MAIATIRQSLVLSLLLGLSGSAVCHAQSTPALKVGYYACDNRADDHVLAVKANNVYVEYLGDGSAYNMVCNWTAGRCTPDPVDVGICAAYTWMVISNSQYLWEDPCHNQSGQCQWDSAD